MKQTKATSSRPKPRKGGKASGFSVDKLDDGTYSSRRHFQAPKGRGGMAPMGYVEPSTGSHKNLDEVHDAMDEHFGGGEAEPDGDEAQE